MGSLGLFSLNRASQPRWRRYSARTCGPAGSRKASSTSSSSTYLPASSVPLLRLSKKMVSPLGKYGIGLLPRIPASIGNVLKYWFLTDPTKYWNILEIWDPWLRNFIQT